jgi:hypothetical protein
MSASVDAPRRSKTASALRASLIAATAGSPRARRTAAAERDVALVVHQREQRFCFLQASLPQTQIGETAQGLQTRPGAVEGMAATAAKM